ncbi:MAG: hypothetical protein RLZZ519_1074 [Bacteroidota bacterium]|jgi:hypothetical protein
MKSLLIGIFVGFLLCTRGWAMPAGQFEFFADSLTGNQGSQVIVPIRVNHFDSIISVQGTIAFDSAVLAFVGVQNMNLPSMTNANFGTSYVVNGKLTFSWNEANLTPISVADSSEIFGVVFQLIGAPGESSPVTIVGSPTLIEVVNWTYTPISFATRAGSVFINVPTICEIPDSLEARNVQQTQAELFWHSTNPGADYFLEWGIWGFTQGNGIGSAIGTALQGDNMVLVSNLLAGNNYEFYVREACDSLHSVNAGPFGFATLAPTAAVTVFGDSIEGPQGGLDTLFIRANGFVDLISAQGTLSWDTAVASFNGLVFGLPNMSLANFGQTAISQGILSFSWNDPTLVGVTIANSAAIFGVKIQYEGAAGASCQMNLVQNPTPWEFVDLSFNTAQLTLQAGYMLVTGGGTGVASEAFDSEWHAYPNPVSSADGRFVVHSNSDFPLVHALTLANGHGQNQPIQWTIQGNSIVCQPGASLAPGLYLLRIDTLSGSHLHKILINKR